MRQNYYKHRLTKTNLKLKVEFYALVLIQVEILNSLNLMILIFIESTNIYAFFKESTLGKVKYF